MCLYVHISVFVYTYMVLCIHTYGFMLRVSDMCLYDGLMHVNRYVELYMSANENPSDIRNAQLIMFELL